MAIDHQENFLEQTVNQRTSSENKMFADAYEVPEKLLASQIVQLQGLPSVPLDLQQLQLIRGTETDKDKVPSTGHQGVPLAPKVPLR